MNPFDSIAGWFYPTDASLAQGRELDTKLNAIDTAQYGPGGPLYTPSRWKTVQTDLMTGTADALDAKGQALYDATHASDSGIGALFKNVFVLVIIGVVLWAFFMFGGVARLKSLSGRAKWAPFAIVAGVVIVAWFIYNRAKQTATDAGAVASNVGGSVKTILGGN